MPPLPCRRFYEFVSTCLCPRGSGRGVVWILFGTMEGLLVRRYALILLAVVLLSPVLPGAEKAPVAETTVVVKIQDIAGDVTFEMMSMSEYGTLMKRLALERKYFDRAQAAAQAAWNEAGRYQGRQFSPRTAIVMLKTMDKDAATKKLNQLIANSNRPASGTRTVYRAPVSALDAQAAEKSRELLQAKLDEIIQKVEAGQAGKEEK